MYSNCYQSQQNPSKHWRWKQARETFEETEGTAREFGHALQSSSGICLRDRGRKHASTSRLLPRAQVKGTKGAAVLPGPGPAIKYWTWISWNKSVWEVVEIPCSFRDEDSSGQPETLSCGERPLEVMEDLLRSRKRKGAFCFCLWEEKSKDYLKGTLYLCLASKEWDPLEQL